MLYARYHHFFTVAGWFVLLLALIAAALYAEYWLKGSVRRGPWHLRRKTKAPRSPVHLVRDVSSGPARPVPGFSRLSPDGKAPLDSLSPDEIERRFAGSKASPSAYSHLLTVCLGDRSKADRLIQFELSRNPKLTREQAILEALDRLDIAGRRWTR